MYVTYFDEVKPNPTHGQNYYLIGGLSVNMERIRSIEQNVTKLSLDIFGSAELSPTTEFHASAIYFGKGPFKGMPIKTRLKILDDLTTIISESDDIRRIYVAIDTPKIFLKLRDVPNIAFAFFCEKLENLLRSEMTSSLLIGDLDKEQMKSMIRNFLQYREMTTPWAYGTKIERIVDTVHFAQSHHSRMIQLADVYLFGVSHEYGTRSGFMAETFEKIWADKKIWHNRSRVWPGS